MKSTKLISTALISFCILGFSSCKLELQSEKLLNRPDVEAQGSSIVISGNLSSSSIKYINVYRKDTNEPDTIIHIGAIFPSGFNSDNKTYQFYDSTALVGQTYQYSCSYNEGYDGVFRTNWSEEIEITTGFGQTGSITPSGTLNFTYNETNKELTQVGTITHPSFTSSSTDWTPYIIIKNGDIKQIFEWNGTEPQVLTSILPSSFFDTDIQILGILLQLKEEDGDGNLKRVIWTIPCQTNQVTNTAATPTIYPDGIIKITTQTGSEGIDYGI